MSDSDKQECQALKTSLLSRFGFPDHLGFVPRLGSPDSPLAYCGIEARNILWPTLYTRLTVYGVLDRSAQDEIVTILRAARQPGFKPVIVRFYEREIWTLTIYPEGGWREGRDIDKEKLLRRTILR